MPVWPSERPRSKQARFRWLRGSREQIPRTRCGTMSEPNEVATGRVKALVTAIKDEVGDNEDLLKQAFEDIPRRSAHANEYRRYPWATDQRLGYVVHLGFAPSSQFERCHNHRPRIGRRMVGDAPARAARRCSAAPPPGDRRLCGH